MTIQKRPEAFSETEIDGEIIVMSLDRGDFFSLTDTAAAIWNLIDGTRDRGGLITALAEAYGAPEAEIGADVDAFLAQLSQAGFIA